MMLYLMNMMLAIGKVLLENFFYYEKQMQKLLLKKMIPLIRRHCL